MFLVEQPVFYNEFGLILFGYPLFVWVDFIAFLITIILIFRLGSGSLVKPVYSFSLSFLLPVLIAFLFGSSLYWLVPLIQTFFVFIGIYLLMRVLGIFDLIKNN